MSRDSYGTIDLDELDSSEVHPTTINFTSANQAANSTAVPSVTAIDAPNGHDLMNQFGRGKQRPPKKEYVRTKVIRGVKKEYRILQNRRRRLRCLSVLPTGSEETQQFQELYYSNRRIFNAVAPATQGLTANNHSGSGNQRTLNNTFCRRFFADQRVLQSFYHYIEALFEGRDIVVLAGYFNMRCCDVSIHNDECYFLWDALKHFIQFTMLEELGLVPYLPNDVRNPVLEEGNFNEFIF